jgi:hypothetical protein
MMPKEAIGCGCATPDEPIPDQPSVENETMQRSPHKRGM